MTQAHAPSQRDRRQVGVLGLTSALILAVIGYLHLFVAPSLAPRVNIRWVENVSGAARADIERQLKLQAGARLDGTTWAYDLGDPSPPGVEAIVNHPSVDDTYHIDRALRVVSSDAPSGTTRLRGGLSALRDAAIVPWLARLASSFLLLSALWLATTGRPPRRVAAR